MTIETPKLLRVNKDNTIDIHLTPEDLSHIVNRLPPEDELTKGLWWIYGTAKCVQDTNIAPVEVRHDTSLDIV